MADSLNDLSINEQSIANDSAVVLGTSLGEVVDTDCSSTAVTENDPEHNDGTATKVKKSKIKVKRPCQFCQDGKLHSALTRHLKLVHKKEPDVKKALSLPRREQIKAFELLRKNGIFLYNKKEMEKDKPSYIRERHQNLGNDNLMLCSVCKGFYSKKYKVRHQIYCGKDSGQVMVPLLPVNSLVRIDEIQDNQFKAIMNKMIIDDVSAMVKSDVMILMIGHRLYKCHKCKTEKKHETEKRVRQTMRQLARLYIAFKKEFQLSTDSADMFLKENLKHLRVAVEELILDDDKMKCGLRIQLQNTIKLAAKMLQAHYLVHGHNDKANQIRDFISVFAMVEGEIFAGALYTLKQRRNKTTRKPANLPDEKLIQLLTEYINKATNGQRLTFEHPMSIL